MYSTAVLYISLIVIFLQKETECSELMQPDNNNCSTISSKAATIEGQLSELSEEGATAIGNDSVLVCPPRPRENGERYVER